MIFNIKNGVAFISVIDTHINGTLFDDKIKFYENWSIYK